MNKIRLGFLILILGAAVFLASGFQDKTQPAPSPLPVIEEEIEIKTVTLSVKYDGKEQFRDEFPFPLSGVDTALDLTRFAVDGEIKTQGEGKMALVTSINDREADFSKREFWELVVNGEPAQVGAGSYIVQAGDKIEWRISTY